MLLSAKTKSMPSRGRGSWSNPLTDTTHDYTPQRQVRHVPNGSERSKCVLYTLPAVRFLKWQRILRCHATCRDRQCIHLPSMPLRSDSCNLPRPYWKRRNAKEKEERLAATLGDDSSNAFFFSVGQGESNREVMRWSNLAEQRMRADGATIMFWSIDYFLIVTGFPLLYLPIFTLIKLDPNCIKNAKLGMEIWNVFIITSILLWVGLL